MTATEAAQARQMLARRLRHEPLDKITGEREFYKSVFMVNNAVLTSPGYGNFGGRSVEKN